MTTNTVIAIVVVVVIVLVVAGLLARAAAVKRRQARHDEAEHLRAEAASRENTVRKHEAGAAEVEAAARKARAEADEHAARAERVEAESAERRTSAEELREEQREQLSRAEEIDPDTDGHAPGDGERTRDLYNSGEGDDRGRRLAVDDASDGDETVHDRDRGNARPEDGDTDGRRAPQTTREAIDPQRDSGIERHD